MTTRENKLYEFRYYRSDNDVDGVGGLEGFVMDHNGKFGLEHAIQTLEDGKPRLHFPRHPHRYICIARLRLSSLDGLPPPGHWRIGYKDGNVANVDINNLFWRGDSAPVRGKPEQDDYEKGLRAGAEILWRSAHREFPEDFLAGVNHVLGQDLQSKKD